MKFKPSKIIIGSLVAAAAISSAGFAYAQNLPSKSTADPSAGTLATQPSSNLMILTADDYDKAQSSQAACDQFSSRLLNLSGGLFKSLYMTVSVGSYNILGLGSWGCYIVDANFKQGDSIGKRSTAAATLESQINSNKDAVINSNTISYALDPQGAGSSWISVGNGISAVLANIVRAMTWLVFQFTAVAGWILSWAIKYGVVGALPPAVHQGWIIVRDIFNMFFILVLIVIALATILRREEYGWRKLLLRLIIVALLVNFSEAICIALIHAADSVGLVFAKGANFTDYFKTMARILSPDANNVNVFTQIFNSNSDLVRAVSGFVLALVMMSAFLAMAMLMVVRYIGLIFLVVLSPAAFVLYIFPNTQTYFNQWRSYLVKYLIWFPVAVFFLRLGHLFFDTGATNSIISSATSPELSVLLIAGFYWGAFYVTKNSGVYGAQTVAGWSQKAGTMLGTYVARGTAFRRMGQGLGWAAGGFGAVNKIGEAVGEGAEKGSKREKFAKATKTYSEGVKKIATFPGRKIEDATQTALATPKVVQQFLAKGEKEYDTGVSRKQFKLAEMFRILGDFEDEEVAKKLKFSQVYDLIKDGRINDKRVENILENGSQGAKDALLAGLYTGALDPKFLKDVRLSDWKRQGGHENNLPDNFMPSIEDLKTKVDEAKTLKRKDKDDPNSDPAGIKYPYKRERTIREPRFRRRPEPTPQPQSGENPNKPPRNAPGFTDQPNRKNPPGGGSSAGGGTASAKATSTTSRVVDATSKPPRQPVTTGGPAQPEKSDTQEIRLDVGNYQMDTSKIQDAVKQSLGTAEPDQTASGGKSSSRPIGFTSSGQSAPSGTVKPQTPQPKPNLPGSASPQQSIDAEEIRKAVSQGVKEGTSGLEAGIKNTNQSLGDLQTAAREISTREMQQGKKNTDQITSSVEKLRTDTQRIADQSGDAAPEGADLDDVVRKLNEIDRSTRDNTRGTPSIPPVPPPNPGNTGPNNPNK